MKKNIFLCIAALVLGAIGVTSALGMQVNVEAFTTTYYYGQIYVLDKRGATLSGPFDITYYDYHYLDPNDPFSSYDYRAVFSVEVPDEAVGQPIILGSRNDQQTGSYTAQFTVTPSSSNIAIVAEAFPHALPPITPPFTIDDDLRVNGIVDITGDKLQLGTLAPNQPGHLWQYKANGRSLLSLLEGDFSQTWGGGYPNPGTGRWVWDTVDQSGMNGGPDHYPMMTLDTNGTLILTTNYYGLSIRLDPFAGQIVVNGHNVLTEADAGLFASPHPERFAIGQSSVANGNNSFAAGYAASAGANGIALGFGATSSSDRAVAIGTVSRAQTNGSVAVGAGAVAASTQPDAASFAFGFNAYASGPYAVSVGHGSQATGRESFATGYYTTAAGFRQSAFGLFNTITGNPAALSFAPDGSDVIFVVGNGTSTFQRSTAMTIRKNGNAAFNNSLAAGPGTISTGTSQVVLGAYNDTTTDATTTPSTVRTNGVFVVGAGDSTTPKNAIRVTPNGTVLVQPGGDLGMGAFGAGEKP